MSGLRLDTAVTVTVRLRLRCCIVIVILRPLKISKQKQMNWPQGNR